MSDSGWPPPPYIRGCGNNRARFLSVLFGAAREIQSTPKRARIGVRRLKGFFPIPRSPAWLLPLEAVPPVEVVSTFAFCSEVYAARYADETRRRCPWSFPMPVSRRWNPPRDLSGCVVALLSARLRVRFRSLSCAAGMQGRSCIGWGHVTELPAGECSSGILPLCTLWTITPQFN